ncbi:MAG: YfiR family protein [Rhodocyclaceae bacterium]
MKRGLSLLRQSAAVALLIPLLILFAPRAAAQMQAPEAELKAAILVNLLLFVDWPTPGTASGDRLLLCYLGDSPVASALRQLDGKAVKGKALQVLRTDAERGNGCHALYFSPSEAGVLGKLAPTLRDAGILLAGDSPDYLRQGAMVNLELAGGRIAFDIDLRSARLAGLAVSSKVLRLARQVLE